MNYKLWEQKTAKHEIRMLSCDGGLKADEKTWSISSTWMSRGPGH